MIAMEGTGKDTIMLPEKTITASVEWRVILPSGRKGRKRNMWRALKVMKIDRLTRTLTSFISVEIDMDRKVAECSDP